MSKIKHNLYQGRASNRVRQATLAGVAAKDKLMQTCHDYKRLTGMLGRETWGCVRFRGKLQQGELMGSLRKEILLIRGSVCRD